MKYYKIIYSDEYINQYDMTCYTIDDYEESFNIKQYDLNEGNMIKDYNENITFYYDEDNGNTETDYVANDLGWFIISSKFREILERIGVDNVQYIPIKIREKSTNYEIKDYSIVNIVGLVNGLNLDESVYKVLKVRDKEYVSVTKPALDNSKLNGLHLVRVKDYIFATFVSDTLKKELEKNNITGCDFLKVKVV